MTICEIKGVGERRAELLASMGMHTVEDVLFDFPRRYIDRRQCTPILYTVPNGEVLFKGRIVKKSVSRSKVFLDVSVELATVRVIFLHAKYLGDRLRLGEDYYFHGYAKDGAVFNPEFSLGVDEFFLRIVPVYRLSGGLTASVAEKIHRGALDLLPECELEETLPASVLRENPWLVPRKTALRMLHAPESMEEVAKARKRIVFEELFRIFYHVLASKKRSKVEPMKNLSYSSFRALPFFLTTSQKKVVAEIKRDLESGYTMNRILNGDVGSGKSVVAYVAARMMVEQGRQVLFMAPTTVLAEQLYRGYVRLFGEDRVYFLSSRKTKAEKEEVYRAASEGIAQVVFGTHSVLSDKLIFRNLSLVITDEQQRFGLVQRQTALSKAAVKHNLYLTATPIPRTMAMTFFANMDISRMEEMPSGRMPITTKFVETKDAQKMISFIQKKIEEGGQAYFVVPAIEQGKSNLTAVAKRLKEVLQAKIGVVHGKLKEERIEDIMRAFQERQLDVLVATTLVEVGVDNPNANVMVILESERFGLSQLHQLRGRVGRGTRKSYCFLMSRGEQTERIKTITECSNGFAIAEKDLAIRGPGSLLGKEQSGRFQISFPFTSEELYHAHQAAKRFLEVEKSR